MDPFQLSEKDKCLNWSDECDLNTHRGTGSCDKYDVKCPDYLSAREFEDDWDSQYNTIANWDRRRDLDD